MKIKVGTQIEADVYQELKLVAARERRPINEIIQDAVAGYIRKAHSHQQRTSGLSRLLEREPIKVSDAQYREIMQLDYYDQ